ncbi:FAD-binding and (Fe-S)-binding domain-containing protein [Agarivorans aestuarii]|uniref:D-lactate dehydrogenase (cytochrome) n=1 Tax=Agarivorans aestuarii TaxID=1563703 RepID=A0ABU7G7E1_9ALTE|nr:FAD-binding and (Fe-S)-binding domain-containing protein [Agarivorans aestuarii]MEE1674365.1 FAD-binding and (Fe-S)-binding domain-containing protein [Agarivorans aestuarii]
MTQAHTELDGPYLQLFEQLSLKLAPEQLMSSQAQTLAYGTDASFYRLIPKLVVKVNSLEQLQLVIAHCAKLALPYTFRAAGTSLSGQAISDSVLILLSDDWRSHQILEDGNKISLQPGVIGADANRYLAPFQRKIGPDPASINACKIGGIAANNASGMCCGTAHNSYHTMASITVVFSDGTVLNTGDPQSVAAFKQSHASLLEQLSELAQTTQQNQALADKIRHKYRLKNTTGYSLNALVDFSDPFEILQHLMIGSEGTLAFIAELTYNTVEEHPHKASTLLVFENSEIACKAVQVLAKQPVAAVELMDGRALASVANQPGMPEFIADLDNQACALLVETRGSQADELSQLCQQVMDSLLDFPRVGEVAFTTKSAETAALWAIRKGMFPAVGAVRETGTTVIIEDVAFPVERLANGVNELQALFTKHGYHEAIIFGHALAGNLHFVFTQGFEDPDEVARYGRFMDEVSQLVAVKYQGSLKAEHGTGRNMAPFVELEWGAEGIALMQQIKHLFDPQGLLNPGVILNDDKQAHLANLKPMPAADDLVDKCIECGFCEPVCPSRSLSLSPRQRIVLYRELSQLRRSGDKPLRLAELEKDFKYQGVDTCAAVGLCADRCPVGINTGDLVRKLREKQYAKHQNIARWTAEHFSSVATMTRLGLGTAALGHKVLGDKALGAISKSITKISAGKVPTWNPSFPRRAKYQPPQARFHKQKVVYIPSCASRTMAPPADAIDPRPLLEVTCSVLEKAGFEVIIPDNGDELCCGMPYHSKGMFDLASSKSQQLEDSIWQLSEHGRWPVLMDTSPCAKRSKEQFEKDLDIHEPIGFIHQYALDKLEIAQLDEPVMLHLTCSSRRMDMHDPLLSIAKRCAKQTVLPEHIYCCGWAGDKGFTTPELNQAALAPLKAQVPEGCTRGYSNSRTCEIGLSQHSGVVYQSILYLVDEVSL